MSSRSALFLLIAAFASGPGLAQEPASFTIAGDWDVRVSVPGIGSQTVHIEPPTMIEVIAE